MAARALDRASAAWQDAEAERAFWEANYAEFLKQYPAQFVAVRDGAVVAVRRTLGDLLVDLTAKDLEPTDVWIRFFEPDPRSMML